MTKIKGEIMKKIIIALMAIIAIGCSAEDSTTTQKQSYPEPIKLETKTPEEIALDILRNKYHLGLLTSSGISLPEEVLLTDFIQQDWTVTTYDLENIESSLETRDIQLLNGEIIANEGDLSLLGIEFETFTMQNSCDEYITRLEEGEQIATAYEIEGTNYSDSYEIVETGFDPLLKINVQVESFTTCCGNYQGACAESGYDPPPPSEILNSSKSFVIESANENGFVILYDNTYIVFDNL